MWRATILRRIHLLIGGLLSIPLVVIGLSGSVLVFQPELQKLAAPDLGTASAGATQPATAIVEAARKAAPPGFLPSLFVAPATLGAFAEMRFSNPQQPGPGGFQVFVDPVSLSIVGTQANGNGLLREIFFLHANLAMHDRSARVIVGWFGVAMCFLGVSGLIMQWPTRNRWRNAVTIARGARGYRLLRQLHGVVGFWFFLVFIVVSFTGVWLSFPQTLNAAAAAYLGIRDLRSGAGNATKVAPRADEVPLDIDGAVALARTTAPAAALRSVSLPSRADQPYRVDLLRTPDAFPIQVSIDPWSKRIIDRRNPADYTAAERVIASMHAIHEGHALGWPWRVLVFLSGLLPAFFVVSGIAMWLIKRRTRRAMTPAHAFGAAGD